MSTERDQIAAERDEVIRVQQIRWQLLLELYRDNKRVSAGHLQSVSAIEIGQRIGLVDKRELEQAWRYLKEAGLLKLMSMGPSLAITKAGIDEVEEAYREPDKQTSHLPPMSVIYNVIHGGVHGSTVQQGTSSSQQTVNNSTAVDWAGLRTILRDIRTGAEALPSEQRDEVIADVDALDAQSRSSRPKTAIVQVCLTSLRAVLANTAGNIAAAPLIAWMQAHQWLLK